MGYSRYIGRVGALAVALGIGSALGAPAIAMGDDAGAETSDDRNTSSSDAANETGAATETDEPGQAPEDEDDVDEDDVDEDDLDDDVDEDEDDVVDSDEDDAVTEDQDEVLADPLSGVESADALESTPVDEGSYDYSFVTNAVDQTPPTSALARETDTAAPEATSVEVANQPSEVESSDSATTFARITNFAAPTNLPLASVVVTSPPPAPSVWQPIRAVVLSVLDGLFGFDPAEPTGTAANPIAVALWGAYRRIESFLGNEAPTITGAQVVGTSLTTDGKLAVTMDLDVTDYDGDALTYNTTSGAHGTLVRNADGTVTYLTDPGYRGTDTVTITAGDAGPHLHGVLGFLQAAGGHTSTAALAVTIADPANTAPTIDGVTSTPQTGNTWTVAVETSDPDNDTVTTGLTATDPAHVTVTPNSDGTYTVTVTDADWAAKNPGAQITVIATATDGLSDFVTAEPSAIGTVNNALFVGSGYNGERDIPALPAGVTYTQVASGGTHAVLLRSDGTVVAVGGNSFGQTNVSSLPALPDGVTYTQVEAGQNHTVLLRSDGKVDVVGDDGFGQINIGTLPALPDGVTYTQVAAGDVHTVLLRSDGKVDVLGDDGYGQIDVDSLAPLPDGVTYTQVAAGDFHTVLLRSDGKVDALGRNLDGQTDIDSLPTLPDGVTYTLVAAGAHHTVLLRSDGKVDALGHNDVGQINIDSLPPLPDGVTYIDVTGGGFHTVLVRSDGRVDVLGDNGSGQLNIPTPADGVAYTGLDAGYTHTILLSAVLEAPDATDDTLDTVEDVPLVLTPDVLLDNDTGDNLQITSVWGAGNGTVALATDGTVVYTPAPNYYGSDSFQYTVTDGTLANTATVTVTVAQVDDGPVIEAHSTPGMGNTWTVTVDAYDPEDGPFETTVAAADPQHVSVTTNGDGTYTVSVTDTAWAASHPGTQISVIVIPSDSDIAPVTQAVGTVNNALTFGSGTEGNVTDIPALPPGVTYTQVAAGNAHTVLLRSDGKAVAVGDNRWGNNSIGNLPALPDGVTYTQVSAGARFTLLLRSDGKVDTVGANGYPETNIAGLAPLPDGVTYTSVDAGSYHSALLRSDGKVDTLGTNSEGQLDVDGLPELPEGVTYTQVSAGAWHTVLLRSDGKVDAVGYSWYEDYGQSDTSSLPQDAVYTKVIAGDGATLLLRDDGTVAALGGSWLGNTRLQNLPALPPGVYYTDIDTTRFTSVFLRSDGYVDAIGANGQGQASIPPPAAGTVYTDIGSGWQHTVVLTGIAPAVV